MSELSYAARFWNVTRPVPGCTQLMSSGITLTVPLLSKGHHSASVTAAVAGMLMFLVKLGLPVAVGAEGSKTSTSWSPLVTSVGPDVSVVDRLASGDPSRQTVKLERVARAVGVGVGHPDLGGRGRDGG